MLILYGNKIYSETENFYDNTSYNLFVTFLIIGFINFLLPIVCFMIVCLFLPIFFLI